MLLRRTVGILGLLFIIGLLAAATPTSAKMNTARANMREQASGDQATVEAYRTYWCRVVTAADMRIFRTSTSNQVVGRLYYGDVFATTGISNNRYHLYDPYSDTWWGWVSADPRWTDYVGHFCVG